MSDDDQQVYWNLMEENFGYEIEVAMESRAANNAPLYFEVFP